MRFEKIIRDRIPGELRRTGVPHHWRHAAPGELPQFLWAKMLEEVEELIRNPSADEAADVIEAVLAFAALHGISRHHVLFRQRQKRTQRGGFDAGIILIEEDALNGS